MRIELKPEFVSRDTYYRKDQQPELLVNTPGLRVVRLRGLLAEPWITCLKVRAGQCALKFNLQGSLLAYDSLLDRQFVCPRDTILFAKGPVEIPIGFSRGEYDHYLVTWQSRLSHALTHWLDFVINVRDAAKTPSLYVSSAQLQSIVVTKEKLVKVAHSNEIAKEALICGYLHEIVVRILEAKNELALATISDDIPLFMKDLLHRVKNNAAQNWSLSMAAELVGYSPFHLSRTFKSFMGYGFPEFVDRCRVELAIQYLSSGHYSVDRVSAMCGYSSTHGLREAMKEHIGFLPSEIRMLGHGNPVVD